MSAGKGKRNIKNMNKLIVRYCYPSVGTDYFKLINCKDFVDLIFRNSN